MPDVPLAGHVSRRLDGRHPACSALLVIIGSYVTLVVATAAVGLVLLHVVLADGRGSWDVIGVNRWFSDRFTPTMDTWSGWGSRLADTTTVIGVAAVLVVVFLAARRWRPAVFLLTALTLEVSVFLTMTLLIDRERPAVPKPDEIPPTSSYPSGHTAAGTVLYLAIALFVATKVRNRAGRISVMVMGFLPGLAVGVARLARGMHHPTDVLVGILLGLACLFGAALTVAVADRARPRQAQRSEVMA